MKNNTQIDIHEHSWALHGHYMLKRKIVPVFYTNAHVMSTNVHE